MNIDSMPAGRERAPRRRLICRRCAKVYRILESQARRGPGLSFCSPRCGQLASRRHPVVSLDGELFYFNRRHGRYVNSHWYLHQAVWCRHHHRRKVPKGFDVHHIDENPLNNDPSNLELMRHGEHTRRHNSVGVEIGVVVCRNCRKHVKRPMREIRRGQNKYCSRSCAMRKRAALKAVGL